MKIGFISPFVPGHLNPMTTLARQLQSRGHDVVYISSPAVEAVIRTNGLSCVSFGEKESPPVVSETFKSRLAQLSKLQGEDATRLVLQIMASRTETMLHSLPTVLAEERIDALVIDTYQFYVELVPMHLGIPYIHVSNALPFDYSGYTPLCLYCWPPETTSAALARNRTGVAKFAGMLTEANARVRAYAKSLGLRIDWESPGSTISKLAWITQMPREFDFASSHWPSRFHYTGPFHDGMGRWKVDFPWAQLTGDPIVYASLASNEETGS